MHFMTKKPASAYALYAIKNHKNKKKKIRRKKAWKMQSKKMPLNYMMFTVFNAGKNTTKMS